MLITTLRCNLLLEGATSCVCLIAKLTGELALVPIGLEYAAYERVTHCFFRPVARGIGVVLLKLLVSALSSPNCMDHFLVMLVGSAQQS